MYNEMPPLVDANTGQPAQAATGWPNVNPGNVRDAWASAGRGGGVTPGGFGAGIPLTQGQGGRSQPFGPNSLMAGGQTPPYAFAPPPFGTPHPAMMGFGGGGSAWGTPASAFDQGMGLPPVGQNPYPQAGIVGGPSWPAFGVEPPPAARKRPQNAAWLTPQATPHRQFEQFEDDDEGDSGLDGWTAWDGSPGWGAWDVPGTPGMALRRTRSTGAGSAGSSRTTPRLKYSRPDNWRPEYSSRPVGLMRLLSFGKGRSSPKGDLGRERTSSFRSILGRSGLHWSLDAKERACVWDIRLPPREGLVVRPEGRNLNYIELEESAFSPPMSRARLIHPYLPWYIYVETPQGSVITVIFLLEVLFHDLQNPVLSSDFWNDELGEDDRKAIHSAWAARVGGNRELAEQGIKRVDFLCDRYMFEGLKRVGDDWELKLKPAK